MFSQLLREIDNLRDVKGVILVAATNRPNASIRAVAERPVRLYRSL
jgi:SpoVK/Ycf46/Vps4 family AAA+-type ATPase